MNRFLQPFLVSVIGGAGSAAVVTLSILSLFPGHDDAPRRVAVEPAPVVPVAKIPDAVPSPSEMRDSSAPATRPAPKPVLKPRPVDPVLVHSFPLGFAPVVRHVIPAVVNIAITQRRADGRRPIPPQIKGTPLEKRYREHMERQPDDEMVGAGSGFIVDSSGVIVTNRHVVGNADKVMVALSDGRSLPARLLGDDPMTDIAVIKVDSREPLPCVTWGDSRKVEIGDWILVAGNPFGFGSSVTAGIISAVGRDLGIGSLDDFIQLDAPINPGNSGGPAFNMRGQVVAVNAAIVTPGDGSVGIGFGIPSAVVRSVVAQIEATGHADHGWLGITLDDTTLPVTIEHVDAGGAAQKGGLRKGDRITAIGGVPVESARVVLHSIAAAKPGTVFTFSVTRHGGVVTIPVRLGRRPSRLDEY